MAIASTGRGAHPRTRLFTRPQATRTPNPVERICLFGQFGCGNSGNDGSLEAMLDFLRHVRPDAELSCVCPDPDKVYRAYGVSSLRFGWSGSGNSFVQAMDKLLLRVPHILAGWVCTLRRARGLDLLIIPGTGILDDFTSGPWGMPYALFRWCLCAKLCGARVWFVSIGAGPVHHPVSRWLMKCAAATAQYRSYRDAFSRRFMETIGIDVRADPVCPDIAFKLPAPEAVPPKQPGSAAPIVGLGVMSYRGWHDDPKLGPEIFSVYVGKITTFLIWLLDQGYGVRILMGDTADQRAVDELTRAVASKRPAVEPGRLVAEPTFSLHDLMQQIAATDVVVATRYHNVVCALKLGKPTISLGYAEKNDLLLADMGLGDFCQHVERLDLDKLIRQFRSLLSQREQHEQRISQANRIYQERLAQQDASLASRLLPGPREAAVAAELCRD